MSNWIVISEVDLYDAKAAALVEAADTVQLGSGQNSRSAQVIADVTAEIRRKISRVTVLDQNLSAIPAGLKNAALDIIIARLKIALEQELSQDERDGLKRRYKEIEDVRDGKDQVDPPDNPMPSNMQQAQVSVESSSERRKATSRKLSGLI
jgi:hypothetical protein